MTITVAAMWPWKLQHIVDLWEWNRLIGTPDTGFPPQPVAVILMSDSRWTFPSTALSSIRHEDTGKKLFQIAANAGAVYTGDVESGEKSLARLFLRLAKGRVQQPHLRSTRHIFQMEYRSRTNPGPLGVFLGSCSVDGKAELWGFNSERDFAPIRLGGINVRAPNIDIETRFLEGLEEIINDVAPQPADLTLDNGALWLAIALQYYVIRPAVDESIGGKIQFAIIDKTGFKRMNFGRLSRTGTPQILERFTPGTGETNTWVHWADDNIADRLR